MCGTQSCRHRSHQPRRVKSAGGLIRLRASAGSRIGDAMNGRGATPQRLVLGLLLYCVIHAMPSIAGRPTMEECLEGSDFIRNAALSRDAGIAAEVFLEQMSE